MLVLKKRQTYRKAEMMGYPGQAFDRSATLSDFNLPGSPASITCPPENECFLVRGYEITILNFISLFSFRENVPERGRRGEGENSNSPL